MTTGTLPTPRMKIQRQIVTFLDFAGPQGLMTISGEFDIALNPLRDHLDTLIRLGYIEYAFDEGLIYRATGRWCPDFENGLAG